MHVIYHLVTKILFTYLYHNFHGSGSPRELSRDLYLTGGERKLESCESLKYMSGNLNLFMNFFRIARYYKLLSQTLKFEDSALIIMEKNES